MWLTPSFQTEKNGCFSTEVLMSSFNLSNYRLRKEFQVKASLVEEGTGRGAGGSVFPFIPVCTQIHTAWRYQALQGSP